MVYDADVLLLLQAGLASEEQQLPHGHSASMGEKSPAGAVDQDEVPGADVGDDVEASHVASLHATVPA